MYYNKAFEDEKRRSRQIRLMTDRKERHAALVEFIKTKHTERSRWSVEAIADVADEYIECLNYREFCEEILYDESRFANGQEAVLERLLCENGWGWVVGLY